MAPRPTWEGHLRLSLVTCPVRLFKAVGESEAAVHFNLLDRKSMNRVKMQYRDPDGNVVERKDMVKGYAIERDRYVVIEDEDLAKLKLDSTKTIDIERFVEAPSINRIYWDQPYYLVPEGKAAQEPFAVIREAMEGEGKVALGRLVMSQRERIVAIEASGRGLLLTTLHTQQEVRDAEDYFSGIADVKIDARMVDIAKQIIAQANGPFDPSEFKDRYEEAVRELVESKRGGEDVVHRPDAEPREGNVIDLMEALRRSLRGAGKSADVPKAEKVEEEEKPAARASSRKPRGEAPPRRKAS